jgi:hypothetical protein
MPNSASQLAALLENWSIPPSSTPEKARGLHGVSDLDFWRGQAKAVALLHDIERTLSGMEAVGNDVSSYRRALPRWYEAVFSYTIPWKAGGQSSARAAIADDPLHFLKILGATIDALGLSAEVDDDTIETVSTALTTAFTLAREDPDLTPQLRRYLLALIQEARSAIEELETFGASSVRSVTAELGGAILVAADASKSDEQRGRWTKIAHDVLIPLAITVVGQVAGTAIQGQIGM